MEVGVNLGGAGGKQWIQVKYMYKMLKELEASNIMFYVYNKRNLLVVFLILRYTTRMANTRQAIFVSNCVPTPCSVSLKLLLLSVRVCWHS